MRLSVWLRASISARRLLIFIGMRFSIVTHALGFIFRKAGGSRDGDFLLLVRRLIFRGDVEDAVGVDVKRDLDLRHAARSRRNSHQMELAQRAVVARHRAFALQDMDLDRGLVVGRGREDFRLARGDRGVARDQRGHHAAQRFDAQRQRRYVEQQDVLDFAAEHAALNGRADRHDFVRVDALVRFLAVEKFFDDFDTRGMRVEPPTRTTSSILSGVMSASLRACLHRTDRALEQIFQSCSSLARVSFMRCFGPVASAVMNGRLISVSCELRKLDLGFFGGFLQALEGHAILARSMPCSFLNSSTIQSTMRLSISSPPRCVSPSVAFTSTTPSPTSRIGNIERAAAEVVDGDRLVLFLVEPVSQRRGGGLVDDAHDFQARDFAGVLGGLALRVIEIRGHRDDRLGDLFAQEIFGSGLQLLQNHRGDFRRAVVLRRTFRRARRRAARLTTL